MIFEVVIPNLGATGGDVIIEEWLVKPGQFVQAGAPLFVVTTDKATVEVEAFRSGYLHSILIEIGSSLPPGSPVALLADTEQEMNEPSPALVQPANSPALEKRPVDAEQKQVEEIQPTSRILASPLARRMARHADLELATLPGTGRQGAILKRDVQRALDLPRAQRAQSIHSRHRSSAHTSIQCTQSHCAAYAVEQIAHTPFLRNHRHRYGCSA